MMTEQEFLSEVGRYQRMIHKLCAVYGEGKEDRQDLFQEILYQLWKSLPDFQGRAAFSTWMYRIALTTALARIRKKQPRIAYRDNLPELPDSSAENDDRQQRLLAAIKRLEPADRAIVLLFLEKLPYREIARITGLTENHVGVKLNRIKNRLQQLLKE
jgi:RNA polymerase sigma-70 factor (ECF subfamily)